MAPHHGIFKSYPYYARSWGLSPNTLSQFHNLFPVFTPSTIFLFVMVVVLVVVVVMVVSDSQHSGKRRSSLGIPWLSSGSDSAFTDEEIDSIPVWRTDCKSCGVAKKKKKSHHFLTIQHPFPYSIQPERGKDSCSFKNSAFVQKAPSSFTISNISLHQWPVILGQQGV